jgi:hypothetical protein
MPVVTGTNKAMLVQKVGITGRMSSWLLVSSTRPDERPSPWLAHGRIQQGPKILAPSMLRQASTGLEICCV